MLPCGRLPCCGPISNGSPRQEAEAANLIVSLALPARAARLFLPQQAEFYVNLGRINSKGKMWWALLILRNSLLINNLVTRLRAQFKAVTVVSWSTQQGKPIDRIASAAIQLRLALRIAIRSIRRDYLLRSETKLVNCLQARLKRESLQPKVKNVLHS